MNLTRAQYNIIYHNAITRPRLCHKSGIHRYTDAFKEQVTNARVDAQIKAQIQVDQYDGVTESIQRAHTTYTYGNYTDEVTWQSTVIKNNIYWYHLIWSLKNRNGRKYFDEFCDHIRIDVRLRGSLRGSWIENRTPRG